MNCYNKIYIKFYLLIILFFLFIFTTSLVYANKSKIKYSKQDLKEAESFMKDYYNNSYRSIKAYKHYYTLNLFRNKFSKKARLFNIADYSQVFPDNSSERLIFVDEIIKQEQSKGEIEEETPKQNRANFFNQVGTREQENTRKIFDSYFKPEFVVYCITIKGNERCKVYNQDTGVGLRVRVVKSTFPLSLIDKSESLIISDLSNIYNISDFYLYGPFVKKIENKKRKEVKIIQQIDNNDSYQEIQYIFDARKNKIKQIVFKLKKYRFKVIKVKKFYKYKNAYFFKDVDISLGARTFTATARSNKFTVNQRIKDDVFEPFRFKSAIF